MLPTDSMIGQCKTNVSQIPITITQITTKYTAKDYQSMLQAVQDITHNIDGAIFNCYFTIVTPVVAADYANGFSIPLLAWNILYNLGFMYASVKGILMFLYFKPPASPTAADYNTFGSYFGSFFMRFIYSDYVPKPWYPKPF